MRIFIGSAKESTATAEWIAAFLSQCGHEALPWYDIHAFPAGKGTLSRLIELTTEVDAAILIFGETDITTTRGVESFRPRDNVVLEYGLFAGVLGHEKTIIGVIGHPTLPVDVNGITYVDVTQEHEARPKLRDWMGVIKKKPSVKALGSDEVCIGYFEQSGHGKFATRIGERIAKARNITMMGSGVAILGQPTLVQKLMERAATKKCKIEIYLANPFSPAVETRLIEEEQGGIKPPDGKRGLLDRLEMLLQAWATSECPEYAKIFVCTQYPTFALVIVDNDYFFYPYSYRMLGNFSPVLVFSKKEPTHKDIINFFNTHYKRIKEDALDAKQVLEPANSSREALHAFGVFFVPPRNLKLYEFGSNVIGYDIREGNEIQSPWKLNVGKAKSYGFHLTVCDVLYFQNEAEVRKAIAEVEYLVTEFNSFKLTDLKIKPEFPNSNSISIAMQSIPIELEVIHHELVYRIYRRASASDYSLNYASTDRTIDDRDNFEFLMSRYKAPYILNRFKPHFTLLSNCPPSEQDACYKGLSELFEKTRCEHSILVDRLAIMSLSPENGLWSIVKEIELKKS